MDRIERAYQDAKSGVVQVHSRSTSKLEADARRIIGELDDEGRWITARTGERLVGQPKFSASFRYISSDAFSRNVETLSEYVASVPK